MPNFDGGHYFLTALIPINSGECKDGPVVTSPVHVLRKRLAQLPASPTLRFETPQSPFARVPGLHLARFVIIDDVAYNGRIGENTILGRIKGSNPIVAQNQDHLIRPYLLLAMDFDAVDGTDSTRDLFLRSMWDAVHAELGDILSHAVGFNRMRADAEAFAAYIAECQIPTTMSFNDYYIDPLDVKAWYASSVVKPYAIAGLVGALFMGLGLIELLFVPGFRWLGLVFLAGGIALVVAMVMRIGNAPFPTDKRTSLENVLKSLYLQSAFTRFAIANQNNAARDDGDAALHASFAEFLATHQPSILGDPATAQKPGVLGI